ncbi:uncharacterized protein LOC124358731 isoform X3 [Homalodisca vitripennis]|uniref:uncharacterized protein LOC124358731 isoform X3 n=1 Tax=Homalodisca vitripennis TaxID=197043 RepID=UPI001EEC15D9|nr:uncharacterized protein LOC124358731 isoform X3 [Homalodisca vitripennis]
MRVRAASSTDTSVLAPGQVDMKVSAVGGSEVLRAKPPQLVARRNARERRRVQAVNSAFARLRRVVPLEHSRNTECLFQLLTPYSTISSKLETHDVLV